MPVAEHPNSNQLGIRLKEVNLKSLAVDERFAEKNSERFGPTLNNGIGEEKEQKSASFQMCLVRLSY